MLTPPALFIQLGQLGIILPQRNQTAFISTVWSHLLLTSWIAVIEESKTIGLLCNRGCTFHPTLEWQQNIIAINHADFFYLLFFFFFALKWIWLQNYQLRISWHLQPRLFITSIMPLSWKHMEVWKRSQVKQPFAFQQISYWLFPLDLSTIIGPWWWIIPFFANCKVDVPSTTF